MNKDILLRELKVLFFSCLFGITVFPYIFAFFYMLAAGRLAYFFGVFADWQEFFADLFRGNIYVWGIVLLAYILVQLVRAMVWIVPRR